MKPNTTLVILLIIFALILVYVHVIQPRIQAKGEDEITVITCSDNQHSYAVYLPKNYNKNKATREYRVLFCFDPGGNGIGAVNKFIYAGEKYEWIIVGSLDAKNGPWIPIKEAQEAMLKDIPQRYNVDTKNYYATGFSGGARMAYDMAYNHPEQFKAVIACGAGFGQGTIHKNIAVYHCIGDRDENLDEVKSAYTQLKNLNVNTKLTVFSGWHRWPPPNVISEAIDWIAAQ